MRVLHVINQLGGAGGAEQGLVREASRFDGDVEQIAVQLYDGDDLAPLLVGHGVKVVALGLQGGRAFWNWPLAAWKVLGIARRVRPDVVHTSLFTGNLVGQVAGLVARVPVVSTLTLTGDPELHRRLQPGAASPAAALLRRVAAFVGRRSGISYRAITEDVKATNARALGVPTGRITVIPRGVPTGPPRVAAARGDFGLPGDGPLLVNIGRQTAQKGHLLLLDAFVRVRAARPDAHLAILGREGEASAAVRQAVAEHGLEGRVHLLGYRSDAAALLRCADVFVFSSLAEGLGTAVLEAMAAGVPVVAFDIPPVREVADYGRVAALVPVGDTGALAQAALDALEGGGAHRAAAARRVVEEAHDVAVVAARVEALLRSAAAQRGRARASA